MEPSILKVLSDFIERFGLGGGLVAGAALALHKGVFKLGRETRAEVEASAYKAEVVLLREALAKSEKDLAEFKAIAMRGIQVAHAATKALDKGAPT